MPNVTKTIVLGGAHRGKSAVLNGYRFVEGRHVVTLPEPETESLCLYFEKCYQAEAVDGAEPAQTPDAESDQTHTQADQPPSVRLEAFDG